MDRKERKILFVSLGCDKNLVDTERMLGMLADRGYTFTDEEEEADAAVVNTCCFVNDAKEESIRALLDLAERRTQGSLRALVAAGCLAQRYQDEIRKEIPEVDAVVGTTAIDDIADAVDAVLAGETGRYVRDASFSPDAGKRRIVTTGGHYAYLKIAEGCDKHCTYCVIPSIRGAYRSVPMELLLREAAQLAGQGAKELILVAQETTLYGVDLYGKKMLPELLRRLGEIPGLAWIRLLYCYPEEIDEPLIRAIAEEQKVCHYLDMPVQHGCDAVLRQMGRRTTRREIEAVIDRLRSAVPDICLRTTLISGFPGETAADHKELLRFVERAAFDRLGVFAYSQEEGTPAAMRSDQIPERVKRRRRNEIMRLQQRIAFAGAEKMTGTTVTALVEGKLADEPVYVARTYRDAPDVDGCLFLRTGRELLTGDLVQARVTGAHEYDLIGELEDESTE